MQNPLLVMYKNKVLLSAPDIPLQKSEWDFIKKGSIRIDVLLNASIENATERTFYYVKLTDENVNSLKRRNGERLEFYSLSEIDKLSLSEKAINWYTEFKSEIIQLLSN